MICIGAFSTLSSIRSLFGHPIRLLQAPSYFAAGTALFCATLNISAVFVTRMTTFLAPVDLLVEAHLRATLYLLPGKNAFALQASSTKVFREPEMIVVVRGLSSVLDLGILYPAIP